MVLHVSERSGVEPFRVMEVLKAAFALESELQNFSTGLIKAIWLKLNLILEEKVTSIMDVLDMV